jgi:hypothetical protein
MQDSSNVLSLEDLEVGGSSVEVLQTALSSLVAGGETLSVMNPEA